MGSEDEKEQKVLALPALRGGLLPHALKKIGELTGVYSCELENLEDGAQVVISGPRGQLTHCAQLVLRAAVGDFQDLSTVKEVKQQVSTTRKLTDAKNGETALQAIGRLTGCDLSLLGSQLQIQGPSLAIARGTMKMVERFLASDSADVNEVLQAQKPTAPGNGNSSGRAARTPQRIPPPRRDSEERFVEIPNLSRSRLLSFGGAVLRRLQDLHGVHIKVLDHKDCPDIPKDSLPVRIKGNADSISDCEGSLWQMSQDDFSSIGYSMTHMQIPRAELDTLAGTKKDPKVVQKLLSSWRDILAIDADCHSDTGHEWVLEIMLCGELTKIASLKAAILAFGPLVERSDNSLLSSGLARRSRLLREIAQEMAKHGLTSDDESFELPKAESKSEASKLQQYMRRCGNELLESLGVPSVLKLLGLPGRRFTGMVKDYVAEVGGDQEIYAEDLVIDCDEVKLALSDAATVFIPKSQASGLRLGESVNFKLVVVGERCTAAELEHAAWHPPPAQPGLMRTGPVGDPAPPSRAPTVTALAAVDRAPPVIEVRTDELGRRYFWNHTERTSDWVAPPPHIGYWQRQIDYRTRRHYYFNPGTQKSLWELPLTPQAPSQPSQPSQPSPDEASMPPGVFGAPVALQPVPAAPPEEEKVKPSRPKVVPSSQRHPPEVSERIPPTRRPDSRTTARAPEEERHEGTNWRFSAAATEMEGTKYEDAKEENAWMEETEDAEGEEIEEMENLQNLNDGSALSALDVMIDEQTELDAIVQEALQRQHLSEEQLEAEDDAASAEDDAASLGGGNVMLEEERPELSEFLEPGSHDFNEGEGEEDEEEFGEEEEEEDAAQETWWSNDPEESEEVKPTLGGTSSSNRHMQGSEAYEERSDRRPPLPRQKRRADTADVAGEEGRRRTVQKRAPASPKMPPPKFPDVPHEPPPLAAKKRPEPPKEPPSWWRDRDEVPAAKPPEPPGPPGPPAGPPPRRVTVNVVKLDKEQATERSQPWESQSGQGHEQSRKRLVKSWDSRKQKFTYHERDEDDEASNKKWSKDPKDEHWTQADSTRWTDWNENGYDEGGPRWSKKYKDSNYYSYY